MFPVICPSLLCTVLLATAIPQPCRQVWLVMDGIEFGTFSEIYFGFWCFKLLILASLSFASCQMGWVISLALSSGSFQMIDMVLCHFPMGWLICPLSAITWFCEKWSNLNQLCHAYIPVKAASWECIKTSCSFSSSQDKIPIGKLCSLIGLTK